MRWDPKAAFAEPPGLWRPGVKPAPRRAEADRALTPRESGVAALVLEDRPGPEIAAAVGLKRASDLTPILDSIARKVGARTRWGMALRLRELSEAAAVEAA